MNLLLCIESRKTGSKRGLTVEKMTLQELKEAQKKHVITKLRYLQTRQNLAHVGVYLAYSKQAQLATRT